MAEYGGQEHRIFPSDDRTRIFKVTYGGFFGFSVISNEATGGCPELTKGLPLEYLDRLLLQNQIFGDDLILEALIGTETSEAAVISSQPTLIGQPVSNEEIFEFMRHLWFQPLRGLSLGNPGSLAFFVISTRWPCLTPIRLIL